VGGVPEVSIRNDRKCPEQISSNVSNRQGDTLDNYIVTVYYLRTHGKLLPQSLQLEEQVKETVKLAPVENFNISIIF
jgi:hypothetical protein